MHLVLDIVNEALKNVCLQCQELQVVHFTEADTFKGDLRHACVVTDYVSPLLQQAGQILFIGDLSKVTLPKETRLHYLPTPFRLNELVEAFHECEQSMYYHQPLSLGAGWELREKESVLAHENLGVSVELSEAEFKLLSFLAGCEAQEASSDNCYRQVWGHEQVLDTHALQSQIYRIRQKIEEKGVKAVQLQTTERGYKLAILE